MQARNFIFFSGSLLVPLYVYTYDMNFHISVSDTPINTDQKIAYCFAHGLGATYEQSELFISNAIIQKPCILFNFPDAKNNYMEYFNEHVNLGQDLDMGCLKDTLEKARLSLPNHKFILAGISRGAATITNYVALNQPESIAALVLESPFDSFENIITHLLRRFHVNWIPFSRKIAYKIARKHFPLLNIDGICPINVIHKIPATIPIMIIHSRKDKTIPINSSRNLYKNLLMAGHPNVYLLELASGEHGKLVHGLEANLYTNVLHAFYKQCGLPYKDSYAHTGKNILQHCRPTIEEVNKRIKKTRNRNDSVPEEIDAHGFYNLLSDFNFDELNEA